MTDELRPTPTLENHEQVKHTLQQWLNKTVFMQNPCTISRFEIPDNTGMSNITVLFDTQHKQDGSTGEFVARIQASGENLAFPAYDLPMQYAVMEALGQIDGIRVPNLLTQDINGDILGMPFYIMYSQKGLIPPDIPPYHMDGWLVESTASERLKLWWAAVDMMAELHCQPIDQEPLKSFIAQYVMPKNLEQQLQYWVDYKQWGVAGFLNAHCERALQWLMDNKPVQEPAGFCWGDSRMANVIFNEEKDGVAALLDWEMLTLGNPLQDIAWWIFMDELFSIGLGCPRLEGFPEREQTVKRWQEKTGLPVDNLHYYLVFAGLRISLILARMSIAKGDNSMAEQSFASDYMIRVLEEYTP